jgi:hypothetical protein
VHQPTSSGSVRKPFGDFGSSIPNLILDQNPRVADRECLAGEVNVGPAEAEENSRHMVGEGCPGRWSTVGATVPQS